MSVPASISLFSLIKREVKARAAATANAAPAKSCSYREILLISRYRLQGSCQMHRGWLSQPNAIQKERSKA